jgi:hypothetical protein
MLYMLVEKGRRMNQDGGGGGGGGGGGWGRRKKRQKKMKKKQKICYKQTNKQATALHSLSFFYKRI